MSGSDFTTTPNYALYKPIAGMDVGTWGLHWNANADVLDSALKAHSDSLGGLGGTGPFLQLVGGTVTGPTVFRAAITSAASAPSILRTVWDVSNTDGTGSTVHFSTENVINVSSPIGQSIWGNTDALNYFSPTPSNTTSSLVARRVLTYASTNRGTAPGAPTLWASIFDLCDTTPGPSSVSGQLLTVEIDIEAAGLDDANVRQGLVVLGLTRNYPTAPSSEFVRGIGVYSGDNGAVFKDQLSLGGRYNRAGINFTDSTPIGGAPAILLGDYKSIAFDTAGTASVSWDAAAFSGAGSVHFNKNLTVDQNIYSPLNATFGALFVAGSSGFSGVVTMNTGAVSDPLTLRVNAGGYARVRHAVTGTREWSAGCFANGLYVISDETAAASRLLIDAAGIVGASVALAVGGTTGPTWTTGSAVPSATAPVGSIYSRVGGAVGATLYVSRGGGTWAAVAGV